MMMLCLIFFGNPRIIVFPKKGLTFPSESFLIKRIWASDPVGFSLHRLVPGLTLLVEDLLC